MAPVATCHHGRRGGTEAIEAWTAALRERGGDLFDADASLLGGPRMPNAAQQRLLLREGIGAPFWNSLTVTGKIEGRGRILADMQFPDLQKIVASDISSMALGHLNKGLLKAHGIDEGGEPERGIGGHDVMWFVARDLAFGPGCLSGRRAAGEHLTPRSRQALDAGIAPGVRGGCSVCS
jgi:hypothetical protein